MNTVKERFRKELLESCVPFWLTKGTDAEYGGLLNCLDREGKVYSTDSAKQTTNPHGILKIDYFLSTTRKADVQRTKTLLAELHFPMLYIEHLLLQST